MDNRRAQYITANRPRPGSARVCVCLACAILAILVAQNALGRSTTALGPADVLILVNDASPCSKSVADLYRRYYPQITDAQVLHLGGVPAYPQGLPDCASPTTTPTDEIITRDQYECLIAQPVRNYLTSITRVNNTYCIITTAGMPYRIKDSNPAYANVVYPAGSDPMLTLNNANLIDAASVEADLAVLFQMDPALPTTAKLPAVNRVVNVYQGYRSRIKAWSSIREYEGILNRRLTFNWTTMRYVSKSPAIEGQASSSYTATGRRMSPADIYLVARLDGPHAPGEYPIFAIKQMLDRSAAVSDLASARFVGFNPAVSVPVIDDSANCCNGYQSACVYNLRAGAITPFEYTIDFASRCVPPGGEDGLGVNGLVSCCHHDRAMQWLTNVPATDCLAAYPMFLGLGAGGKCVWDGTSTVMNSTLLNSLLGANRSIIGLLTYGTNGSDGRSANYLLSSGPNGGPLFSCSPGAVFSSLESYNAVTMLTTPSTGQAKISDFIQIGGTAAVGHAFEPVAGSSGGLIQGDYLLRNLLRDDDADGVADLTWIEAAYTAMPYLSWTSVAIGDPLMRPRLGPGGIVNLPPQPGDIDGDHYVGFYDLMTVVGSYGTELGDRWYDPGADLDQDAYVGWFDLMQVVGYYGTEYTNDASRAAILPDPIFSLKSTVIGLTAPASGW